MDKRNFYSKNSGDDSEVLLVSKKTWKISELSLKYWFERTSLQDKGE
jgi:hypothetical protein